jgi:geranylgeranyl diphosphate synthase type 3
MHKCPTSGTDTFQAILEPFRYINSNPGKEIRGKLIEAFNLWLNVPADKLLVISKVVNMLHAASLM